jgi:ribosomal-protein-alanine N-acetyltransferase
MIEVITVNADTPPSDLRTAYSIHQKAHPSPWAFSTFEDCFTRPYYGVLAYSDQAVAGYAIMLEVLDEATLMDIAVSENRRSRGVGQALVDEVVGKSNKNNMAVMWLEVRQSNQAAIALYNKNGFEHIETRKNYYSTPTGKENALVMRRNSL